MTRNREARMSVMQDWCDWMAAGSASPATISLRRRTIGSLLAHAGDDAELDTVTPMQIARWLGSQKAAWTRTTYRAGAVAFFSWLQASGQRVDDPTATLPKARKPRSVPDPVDAAVLHRMFLAPLSGRSLAYITLAAFAGLRVSEIAAMHAGQVEGEWLRIKGKGGHTAMLPMHERIGRLAVAHASGFWFPGMYDGHVRPSSVSQTIKRAMLAAGAPPTAHAHQLRHGFGTELMKQTGDIRVVSELMRHASIQTTMGYTFVSDDRRLNAISRLRA